MATTKRISPCFVRQDAKGRGRQGQRQTWQGQVTQTVVVATALLLGGRTNSQDLTNQRSPVQAATPILIVPPVKAAAPIDFEMLESSPRIALVLDDEPSVSPTSLDSQPLDSEESPGTPTARSPLTDSSASDPSDSDAAIPAVDSQTVGSQPLPSPVVSQPVGEASLAGDELALSDVVASMLRSYPEVERAQLELSRAGGELLSTYGFYDKKISGEAIEEPTGFYENFRHRIGIARQTWWGGYLSAGYRIGRGVFQPWYLERETETGGEFKIEYNQALLRGRNIDPARLAVFQATLAQRATRPAVQQSILRFTREASGAYWDWVASGRKLVAVQELLELAKRRGKQLADGVKAGRFAEIDELLNRQLIAERTAKQFESRAKFEQNAIKLSLFVRDAAGDPLPPPPTWLPKTFPKITDLPERDFNEQLQFALLRRPEPRLIELEVQKYALDRRLAVNDRLPQLDFISEFSQDLGGAATSSDDKGQFVLVLGVQGELQIEQRKARGKIRSSNAKIAQAKAKLQFQQDKIGGELKRAITSLQLASQVVEQNESALETAQETLKRYRFAFEKGKIDLIYLNVIETKANETQLKLIDAQEAWFLAYADLQAAMGIDPLEQTVLK